MSREPVWGYSLSVAKLSGPCRAITRCRCCHEVLTTSGTASQNAICGPCYEWLDGAKAAYVRLIEELSELQYRMESLDK